MQNHEVCVALYAGSHITELLHFTYFSQFTAGWHCNLCFCFQVCVALRSQIYLHMCSCAHYAQEVTCVVFNPFLCLQNCGSQASRTHWHTAQCHISNLQASHTNLFCKMCVLLLCMCVGINSCNPAFSGIHCRCTHVTTVPKELRQPVVYCPLDKLAFSTFTRNQLQNT